MEKMPTIFDRNWDGNRKANSKLIVTDFDGLKEWLPKQKSIFGNDCGIEGIVWHNLKTGEMCKI